MIITDTETGNVVNLYVVKCSCGTTFRSRPDRYRITCPQCCKAVMTRDLGDEREYGDDEVCLTDI